MSKRVLISVFLFALFAPSAWSRVLVRWTESAPPPQSLGLKEVVIPFAPDKISAVQTAARQGYRVYVEVAMAQFPEAQKAFSKGDVAGFILDPGNDQQPAMQVQKLQAENPKVSIRLLSANGKQPQMRGQTVTTHNGVLQVSSATAQPWLDSNLAMVRFQQASHPGVVPIYSFTWELSDSLQQENGPSADDYAMAIAESAAIHADLVLDLHATLEKGLLENQPAARATWDKIISCLKFASAPVAPTVVPWSDVGIFADNYDSAYEPMNLMARHNIPFRVLSQITSRTLDGLKVAVALTAPDPQGAGLLNAYAGRGGTVVVVDAKGKYPWQTGQPTQTAEHTVSYTVGKGRVFELSEPISDPETFAEDVRRLTPKNDVLISTWNALTTIAVPYRDERTGEVVVDLVNFAQETMRVQLELKGSYSSIRYETPDHGCCQELTPVKHDGFTDFVVPALVIAGRVHLKPLAASAEPKQK